MTIEVTRQYCPISTVNTLSHGSTEYSYGPYLRNIALDSSKGKESVDEGGFTPGVYRINPYSIQSESFDLPEMAVKRFWNDGYWTYESTDSGKVGAAPLSYVRTKAGSVDYGNIGDRALQAAHAKIAMNNVGMGENLGELRETLNLLRHPFKQFRDYLWDRNFYRTGMLQKLYHFLKYNQWGRLRGKAAASAAASAWLEFRYGMMPLVYTCQDIIEEVNKKVMPFDRNKIRSARRQLVKTEERSFSDLPFGVNQIMYNFTGFGTDQLKVNASVQYTQAFPLGIAEILGLTPRFIPELAWELTRLSFVVDWWFSVGPWLGSLRVKPGIKILGNTVGYKSVRKYMVTADAKYGNFGEISSCGCLGVWTQSKYQRLINQNLPLTPQWDLDFRSYFHVIDSLSLTLQQVLNTIKKVK